MLRKMVGKVVRSTPGLRRVHELVRGGAADTGNNGADAPTTAFGAETPRAPARPEAARPAPAAAAPPKPEATTAPAPAKPEPTAAPAPVADAPPAAPSAGKEAAPKKASSKKGTTKKAAEKKAAEKKAAPEAPAAADETASRSAEEVEALRAEAERKKAEIRARKEAEAKAAGPEEAEPAKPAVSGIAALIAQTGGKVDDVGAKAGVRATSGGTRWVAEDTDTHLADDGVEYWGAIDNDSSRAYARGDTLIIDQWECINCGTCVENTEHVFVLPDDAKAVVISQEGPMDLIQDAIDACPVTCIHWTDDPSQYEQINDAEGNQLG